MTRRLLLVGFLSVGLASCGSPESREAVTLDVSPFSSFTGTAMLCFDLRSDTGTPAAGLLLRVAPGTKTDRRDVLLPFAAKGISQNKSLLLTSGSYEQFSILSMSFGNPSLGSSTVSFNPQWQSINDSRPNLTGLDPGLYYKESGAERWLVFIDATPKITGELKKQFPTARFETFDSLAIAYPETAEELVVRPGVTVFPTPSARVGNVFFFAKAASSGQGADRAELHYAVKPTAAQVAASNNGLKLVVVFFLPLVTLIFLNPEDIQRPKLRVAAICCGIGLQLLIIVVMLWLITGARRPTADSWGDAITTVLGLVSQIVIILVKSKRGTPPQVNAPDAGVGQSPTQKP
jgi:hypothetical protein